MADGVEEAFEWRGVEFGEFAESGSGGAIERCGADDVKVVVEVAVLAGAAMTVDRAEFAGAWRGGCWMSAGADTF